MSKVELFDTHCHIHESVYAQKYDETQDELIADAKFADVNTFICVGTSVISSVEAVSFVQGRAGCFASLAIHPHETAERSIEQLTHEIETLDKLLSENSSKKIVAIGECGLDYFYHKSKETKERQKQLFKLHIELAQKYNLPMIFHIRDPKESNSESLGQAFADFFQIIDEYKNVRGIVHSFSANLEELKGALDRGLYVGLNGIMTFTKQTSQLQAAKMVPLENLVLETDAPFLTPAPFRGTMCKPKHIRLTAQFLSELRGENLEDLARVTTHNAKTIFGIK